MTACRLTIRRLADAEDPASTGFTVEAFPVTIEPGTVAGHSSRC